MSTTTSGYRFLAITFDAQYGPKQLTAEVWGCENDGSDARREYGWSARVQDGPFGGDAVEDLTLHAYVGHEHPGANDSQDDIWGLNVEFRPGHVRLADAERMAKVLKAVDRRMAKIADEDGYPQGYAEWLARLAKILGCTRIRCWEPDGYHRRKLGRAMKISEGAAYVERVAQKWGTSNQLEAAFAS